MSLFFAFFFLSGFCSLVYQVVWLRVAMAGFGVTTPMISIVLSIFMAGLAAGSWTGGRAVRSFESRTSAFFISLYAAVELMIGISGLAVAPLLRTGRTVLSGQSISWDSANYYLASGAWVALVMLPFCTCMGATFPLAMAGIRGAFRNKSSTSFSYLYLANVLGAMTGTLGSAFISIELWGFSRTLWIAAFLNAAIAILAFIHAARHSGPTSATPSGSSPRADRAAASANGLAIPGALALALLFTSGLTSLGMEVVWTRQFTPILGPVVYAFAAMLTVYLAATALGSRMYRAWARLAPAGNAHFAGGATAILAGACAFLPLLATDVRITAYGYRALQIGLGIGPFSAVAGFMTPMLVDRWSLGNPNRAGRAYAVNAVGCILGPLLAGFVLLPRVGERWSLVILALPFFAFGLWYWTGAAAAARPALAGLLAAGTVLSIPLVTLTRGFETLFAHSLVRRDYTATSIATGEGRNRKLIINGVGISSLTPITKIMVHMPMASLQATPRSVLVLCFGMGTSFRAALSWGVPVTVAELVPSVPSLVGFFHADGAELLWSPNAHVIIDDARRFMERTQDSFDVIVVDPPPPVAAAGSSLLYSEEFYRVARRHLRPGGILQQWLPGGDATVTSAFAQALHDSFREVRVYGSIEGWGQHFFASGSPIARLTAEELAGRLPPAAARDLIEWGPNATPTAQFESLLQRERPIEDLIQERPSAPPLTDDRPVNEYYMLRNIAGRLAHFVR